MIPVVVFVAGFLTAHANQLIGSSILAGFLAVCLLACWRETR